MCTAPQSHFPPSKRTPVVQYRVADEFLYAANCHCSNCRRTPASTCTWHTARWWTRRAWAPTEHIFVGSKAPWYEITDELPRNEEY